MGCAHVRVCPSQGVAMWGCAHVKLCPCEGVPISGCGHVGVCPCEVVPSEGVTVTLPLGVLIIEREAIPEHI